VIDDGRRPDTVARCCSLRQNIARSTAATRSEVSELYRGQRVCVIIPCYNVARHIAEVLSAVPAYVDRIVAVDDGSRDETVKLLEAATDERIEVVRHERNRGVGAAMRTGLARGVAARADLLVKVDGDGQMDLDDMPKLLDSLIDDQRYGYAKGNRLVDQKALSRMPRLRVIGNFALTFLTKLASGYWYVVDPQNGYLAIRRDVWERLDPDRISDGYFFENDMLVGLNILDVPVKDVPIPARYGDERSYLRVRRVFFPFVFLLVRRTFYRIYVKYMLRDFSPIALFLIAGLPLFLWGVAFGAYQWWDHAQLGIATPTGTVIVSVVPLILGFQLLLQALVLDIQNSPR
jgi:glycosyltransferase involved in cell wall biosynthesis